MAGDLIQFVDSIASSPTIRLNLNDESTWSCRSFTAPPPRLRRSVSANAMRDGAHVSSSQYEARTLTLELELKTASQDTNATALQTLARELDRTDNYLKYQPTGATKPVFFRVFRSDMSAVVDVTVQAAFRILTVELLAEPFALGLREDAVAGVTVTHNPAFGTNSMSFSVTAIGDVDAEPVIWFTSPGTPGDCVVTSSLDNGIQYVQAEAATTLKTDTATQAHADFSGSSAIRCTFATLATLANRAEYAATPPAAGTYRVYMRCRATAATAASYSARIVGGFAPAATETITFDEAAGALQMVDLGVISTSQARYPRIGYHGSADLPTASLWNLQLARNSGAPSLDVDYLLFVPASERSLITYLSDVRRYVFDSTQEQVSEIPIATTPFTATGIDDSTGGVAGSFPLLHAGQATLIHVIPLYDGRTKTDTLTVSLSYWPRYLYVRPSAT